MLYPRNVGFLSPSLPPFPLPPLSISVFRLLLLKSESERTTRLALPFGRERERVRESRRERATYLGRLACPNGPLSPSSLDPRSLPPPSAK